MRLPGSTVADIPIPEDMIPRMPRSPPTGYAILIPFLQKQGRSIERVLGDGNCLFRALSLQLTGMQDHHLSLRKIIAQCESKATSFQGIHAALNKTITFADHVKNIAKTCVWGTSLEIIAVASIFQMDTYVVTDSYRPGKPTWLKYSPNLKIVNELSKVGNITSNLLSTLPCLQKQWLEITYVSRCHFDSVSAQGSSELSPPSLDYDAAHSSATGPSH